MIVHFLMITVIVTDNRIRKWVAEAVTVAKTVTFLPRVRIQMM